MKIEIFDVVVSDAPNGKFEVRMIAWPQAGRRATLVKVLVFWVPGQAEAGWGIKIYSPVHPSDAQQLECRDFAADALQFHGHIPHEVPYVRL